MTTLPDATLGSDLRRLRQERGLGMREAARLAGTSHGSLRDWEADRFLPAGATLDRLLAALEAPPRTRARLLARASPAYARIHLVHEPLGAPVDLGGVLRAMRRRQGRTQADVARALGVSQGALAKWESGESDPTPERLHAVLFALGASADEAVALTRAARGEAGAPTEGDDEARIREIGFRQPMALRESMLLGLEAELWWRATRDPSADAALAYAVAMRAQQALFRGDLDEARGHVGRAVRLAHSSGVHEAVVSAVYVGGALARQDRGGAARRARMAERWEGRVRSEELRGWLATMRALALARVDDGSAGVALLSDLVAAAEGSPAWSYYVENLVEAYLLAGRVDEAREALEKRPPGAGPGAERRVAVACGQPLPEAEIAALRADPHHLVREEARRLDRLAERVRRGLPARLD